jgi:hypothetical protein
LASNQVDRIHAIESGEPKALQKTELAQAELEFGDA